MPASLAASARGKPSSAPAIACRRAAAARSFRRQVRADCQRPSTHLRPPPTGLDATRITSARVDSNHLRVRKFAGRYNFVRIHKSRRITPAMAAGITGRLWSMEDVVALLDAREAPPAKRGTYKPRAPEAA